MIAGQPNTISVIDPINPAIERVKTILFRPFDLSKWFTIGFCAWLAYMGSGGGGGGPQWNLPGRHNGQHPEITEGINTAKEYLLNNLFWIIPAVVIAVILMIALSLLAVWINSRGKFMFLHCVAGNKSEIKVPWAKYREQANSLFLFRIVVGLIGMVIIAVPVFGIGMFSVTMKNETIPYAVSIPAVIILGLIVFVMAIALSLVNKFTFDFVVPIMFLRTVGCRAAWGEFMAILTVNKSNFTLYILFQIVIAIAIGTVVMIGTCIACCLCGIGLLLMVPYIGTVILLPIFVFKQAYPLYYLRQFGAGLNVFIA